ncbi:MAG: hypothetical protein ACKN9T_06975 [Candidatus Methylumidiphilus sp.]
MKLLKTLKHEFLLVLPPTIFFLVAFTLIMATQRLILREYGIPLVGFGAAVIGALLVGKVVLIADHLPFVNKFPDKPLLYNTLWKTFIYFLAVMLFRYLEHGIPLLFEHRDFLEANRHLVDKIIWPHFWLIHMWLAVLFFVYCALRELVGVIGRERVIAMFIGGPGRETR